MQPAFSKRIYTVRTFIDDTGRAFNSVERSRAGARGGRIDKAFTERIMLAVTQVNGCRYCSYAHTRVALQAGIAPDEIQRMLAGDFGTVPLEQVDALMFAQHYAETHGDPDPAAWQRVVDGYGPETADAILLSIRMIMIGNLLGNTFDALLSRFQRRPAPHSSIWQELGVLLGTFVVIPAGMVRVLARSVRRRLS